MQSPDFRFQPLPSTAELNTLTPTSPDSLSWKHLDTNLERPSDSSNVPGLHYEPVQEISQPWPLQPESWYRSRSHKVIRFVGNLLLTLSPIIFLMLAFAALSVDGKPLSRKGQIVLEAARLAPTLFPIIFAAVVGRLMRTFALWKAEKGASLGLLEQLNGSQNMLTSLGRALHLQGLSGMGISIIILWCLSPLGGQSSLRVLEVSSTGEFYERPLAYFDTENYTSSAFISASDLGWSWPTISAIYQACLLAPDKVLSSSTDLWGNVKIPLLQSLPGYDTQGAQDWIDVPFENTTYASLTGVMVNGLDHDAIANFTIETAYLNLSCSEPKYFQMGVVPRDLDSYYSEIRDWTGPLTYHSNTSAALFANPYISADAGDMYWSSFIIDTNWNYTDLSLINQTDINLIYLSQNTFTDITTGYKCSIGYSHVEAWVNCNGYDCYVARMRASRQPHPPSNITPFNQGFINYYGTLIARFPWVTGQQHASVTSPTDWYVAGSALPYNPSSDNAVYTNATGSQVSRRLGTLINTFWQTSMTLSSLVQPRTDSVAEVMETQQYSAVTVSARMQTSSVIYTVSKLWTSLTVIISLIMAFCGIAGAVFKFLTTAPDILGYVSSMTKDNPYFQGTVGDDTLDGMERARLLQKVVVQIGNVKPWDDKGYIAFRRVKEGEDRSIFRLRSLPFKDRIS